MIALKHCIFRCEIFRRCQLIHSYRHKSSRVMPVNTYYRYKHKDKFGIQPQNFKYFLVLDFEATCDEASSLSEMEIIEFPCLKVCGSTFQVLDIFHKYVRPVKHPILTTFCTNLTGIDQALVEHEMEFKDVLELFLKWLRTNDFQFEGTHPDSIFVTSGNWDLQTMLWNQCRISDVPFPVKMTSWINIKKAFVKSTGVHPRGILDMLNRLDLQHEGKLHSGLDDSKNIVRIMQGLANRGYVFERTGSLAKNRNTVDKKRKNFTMEKE